MNVPALEVRQLRKNFGALEVARGIDLVLPVGARHALIGPNGAGKTTLVNLITGVLSPTSGRVLLAGADVTGLPQYQRARRGLARTFQINQLFAGLTVLENVIQSVTERRGLGGAIGRALGRRGELVDEAMAFLHALDLSDHALTPVGELPYGRQRIVEIAMALAQRPRVLLLDEPAAGIPSSQSRLILDTVEALDADIALLVIEHDMEVVFRLADQITVLVAGEVLSRGTPAEMAADREVRAVYLGEAFHG
jgi:ABC-type branched-subunit amino acid transport system ATPase component